MNCEHLSEIAQFFDVDLESVNQALELGIAEADLDACFTMQKEASVIDTTYHFVPSVETMAGVYAACGGDSFKFEEIFTVFASTKDELVEQTNGKLNKRDDLTQYTPAYALGTFIANTLDEWYEKVAIGQARQQRNTNIDLVKEELYIAHGLLVLETTPLAKKRQLRTLTNRCFGEGIPIDHDTSKIGELIREYPEELINFSYTRRISNKDIRIIADALETLLVPNGIADILEQYLVEHPRLQPSMGVEVYTAKDGFMVKKMIPLEAMAAGYVNSSLQNALAIIGHCLGQRDETEENLSHIVSEIFNEMLEHLIPNTLELYQKMPSSEANELLGRDIQTIYTRYIQSTELLNVIVSLAPSVVRATSEERYDLALDYLGLTFPIETIDPLDENELIEKWYEVLAQERADTKAYGKFIAALEGKTATDYIENNQ